MPPGKTPRQISRFRVLDPACGSGSFLIGAYRKLLDYHRDWYLDEKNGGPKKHTKQIYQGAGGQWYLTTAEKKRILLNNIYGVDIDPQAVEVSKLNLLLCVLENENQNTLSTQLKIFHERALPDLSNNIKCGNSLIGPDFYEGKQLALFDEETRYRVNAFNWQAEFPEIFKGKTPGFDAVIGNPPYVEFKRLDAEIKHILSEQGYKSISGKYDIYVPFVEKGIHLLHEGGFLGFIMPTMFTKRDYGKSLRTLIKTEAPPLEIVDFGDFQVFQKATNYVGIFILEKDGSIQNSCSVRVLRRGRGTDISLVERNLPCATPCEGFKRFEVRRDSLGSAAWVLSPKANLDILHKILESPQCMRLNGAFEAVWEGIASGKDEVFYVSETDLQRLEIEKGITFFLLKGRDVKRWGICPRQASYVVYPYSFSTGNVLPENEIKERFPNAYKYLIDSRKLLGGRSYFEKSNKQWYELWCPRDPHRFVREKIVTPEISSRNNFALDRKGCAFNTKVYGLLKRDETAEEYTYLLGLLNSRLLDFLYKLVAPRKAGGFYAYKTQFLKDLPLRRIDFSDPAAKAAHDRMVSLVDTMLDLHKQLSAARTEHDKTLIQRQVATTDKQIDKLVYELYGLTEEEVRIVEGGS